MKESLGLYIFLLSTWMVLSTYWYTCGVRNRCISEVFEYTEEAFLSSTTAAVPFGLKVAGTQIMAEDNIRFIRSRHVPIISGPVKRAFNRVQSYLSIHDDEAIEVTGAYASTEKNNTLLNSLGLARAGAFKAWMIKQGIGGNQIVIRQVKNDSLTFTHDTLISALTFKIIDLPEEKTVSKKELSEVENRLKDNYHPFYFEPSSTALLIDQNLRSYVQDLKTYMEAYPDHTIILVGHTDESGDAETNVRIGRERAEYVMQLLSQAGINDQQMLTNSKGASMPVADHGNKKGINANRRVEIQFN